MRLLYFHKELLVLVRHMNTTNLLRKRHRAIHITTHKTRKIYLRERRSYSLPPFHFLTGLVVVAVATTAALN